MAWVIVQEIPKAYERLESARAVGKVVVDFDQ
jgi:D-arabinose 1-dehydrogenase-like Zn-dependent alcohol dehydrogenase